MEEPDTRRLLELPEDVLGRIFGFATRTMSLAAVCELSQQSVLMRKLTACRRTEYWCERLFGSNGTMWHSLMLGSTGQESTACTLEHALLNAELRKWAQNFYTKPLPVGNSYHNERRIRGEIRGCNKGTETLVSWCDAHLPGTTLRPDAMEIACVAFVPRSEPGAGEVGVVHLKFQIPCATYPLSPPSHLTLWKGTTNGFVDSPEDEGSNWSSRGEGFEERLDEAVGEWHTWFHIPELEEWSPVRQITNWIPSFLARERHKLQQRGFIHDTMLTHRGMYHGGGDQPGPFRANDILLRELAEARRVLGQAGTLPPWVNRVCPWISATAAGGTAAAAAADGEEGLLAVHSDLPLIATVPITTAATYMFVSPAATIDVVTLTGKKISLAWIEGETLWGLKRRYQDREGHPPANITLITEAFRFLDDDPTTVRAGVVTRTKAFIELILGAWR